MKDKIITIGFIVILLGTLLINIIIKDKKVSTTERRKLEQFPEITTQKIIKGEFCNGSICRKK